MRSYCTYCYKMLYLGHFQLTASAWMSAEDRKSICWFVIRLSDNVEQQFSKVMQNSHFTWYQALSGALVERTKKGCGIHFHIYFRDYYSLCVAILTKLNQQVTHYS